MPALRKQRRHACAGGAAREAVEGQLQFPERRRLRSERSWRHGRDLCASRCDTAGTLRRAAEQSDYSADGEVVEGATEVARKRGNGRRIDRVIRALLAVRAERSR